MKVYDTVNKVELEATEKELVDIMMMSSLMRTENSFLPDCRRQE